MIFISYRNDNLNTAAYASELGRTLVSDGLVVKLDSFESNQDDWIEWMDHALDKATYILLLCTPSYRLIFDEQFKEHVGRGAAWEVKYIKNELYDNHGKNLRFIPVLLNGSIYSDIPKHLRSK